MSHCFDSPKLKKKTNPIEYNYYENVKERHFFGKYKPDKDIKDHNNSKNIPEISTFNFDDNNLNPANKNININNNENNETNKLKSLIKSIII